MVKEIKKDQEKQVKNIEFVIKLINLQKGIAYIEKMFYSNKRCDMIAMKREVAALSS